MGNGSGGIRVREMEVGEMEYGDRGTKTEVGYPGLANRRISRSRGNWMGTCGRGRKNGRNGTGEGKGMYVWYRKCPSGSGEAKGTFIFQLGVGNFLLSF